MLIPCMESCPLVAACWGYEMICHGTKVICNEIDTLGKDLAECSQGLIQLSHWARTQYKFLHHTTTNTHSHTCDVNLMREVSWAHQDHLVMGNRHTREQVPPVFSNKFLCDTDTCTHLLCLITWWNRVPNIAFVTRLSRVLLVPLLSHTQQYFMEMAKSAQSLIQAINSPKSIFKDEKTLCSEWGKICYWVAAANRMRLFWAVFHNKV